ncbi:MAG: endonuclease/exonuclease/phosphatase family protein, partial [Schlesneria sp.]
GYQAQWFGQKTYNGVALLSRTPATDVLKNIPGFEDDMARVITGTVDGVRVIGAYFPNGQEPGSDKFEYKMEWLSALRRWVKDELAAHPKLVLMGDYNITFDDADVWDPEGLRDTSFSDLLATLPENPSEEERLLQAEGPRYRYGSGCISDGVFGDVAKESREFPLVVSIRLINEPLTS